MKKNFAKSTFIFSAFMLGLISCGKTVVSTENDLVGDWKSTQVDSLIHFVVPEAPDTLVSCNYESNHLEIHEDGSFMMITLEDTIVGSWEQFVSDSLRIKVKDAQGKVQPLYPLKIAYVDQSELILVSFGGFLSLTQYPCDTEMSVVEDTRYEAKVYYVRTR